MRKSKKLMIQVQGHRGERGHLPENTVPAFMGAMERGVDVLELDVVISKDRQVVVSHEPFMSSRYVSTPEGKAITKEMEKSHNLYEMTYDTIRQFDCGSRGNVKFPDQKKMKTYKPLLGEVINRVEQEVKRKRLPAVKYNIEIKSETTEYGISQPLPDEFVDLVMQVINGKKIGSKVNIQSFDPAPLHWMHQKYPEIELAFLVEDGTLTENLALLNFPVQIYSPHFKLVTDSSFVAAVHGKNMKLIPWTVNKKVDIRRMIDLQVDGIISDYPDRVLEELKGHMSN